MPIANIQDAHEVEYSLQAILNASSVDDRLSLLSSLFLEVLDFEDKDLRVPLAKAGNNQLPEDAYIVAKRDGVSVVYIPMDDANSNRVTGGVVAEAAKVVSKELADSLLLLFTNRDRDQLHIISPDLTGSRVKLQRLVAHRRQVQRTVPQQIANMWDDYGNRGKTMGEAIAVAFSVEPVTKDFFEAYRRIFEEAKAQVGGFGNSKDEQEKKHLFTQTLFNRLMFVYFLSRKGWLVFKGNSDYLNALQEDYGSLSGDTNFYAARLKPLFFAGLNNPQSINLMRDNPAMYDTIGDVRFLNGGLFEKTELDDRDGITVPDEAIQPLLKNLFDRFNFTVLESTPYDQEVAVDPEMLGKVFEELVTERHSSGAYYTPRPVVAFMCREALKGYLTNQHPDISEDAVAIFIDQRDTSGLTSREQARAISDTLDKVTVVDPACGSGAYLLGMLHELVELQGLLYNVTEDAKSLYRTKQDIISRNLYGVDKDEFAVNIAMLRLWLSLSIEYDDDDPPPLPNLDFKVVDGDSIAGPDPNRVSPQKQGQQADFLSASGDEITTLADLKHQYTAAHGSNKDALKQQIAAVEDSLARQYPAATGFQWHVKFAEVFANGGFDIAIANPPYVRQEDIGPSAYKKALVTQYADAASARSDLYCYFYARALQLLKDGGMHVFVCSNSWLDVGYGAKLQEYLLNNAHILAVFESAVERQFSTADINTIISLINKSPGGSESGTRFVSLRDEFDIALADPGLRREVVRSHTVLQAEGTKGNRFVGDKWGGKYLRAPDIYHHVMNQYAGRLVTLGDITEVRRGVSTGANKFFFLTSKVIDEWGIEEEFLKPVMTSPQESKSIVVNPNDMPVRLFLCSKERDSLSGTGALDYIIWGEEQSYHEGKAVASRTRWYDLGARGKAYLAMNYLIGTTSRTFFSSDGLHFGDNFQEVHPSAFSPLRLCVALNSSLAQLMFNISGRANFGGGLLKIQTFEIRSLRVPNPGLLPEPEIALFDSVDWDVLTPSAERQQIDDAVYDALGLTAGERDAVYEGVSELIRNRIQKAGSI